MIKHYWRPV